MGGAVSPLPQYAFMAWCSVRGSTGTLPLHHHQNPTKNDLVENIQKKEGISERKAMSLEQGYQPRSNLV
jgi:hypothetical protein